MNKEGKQKIILVISVLFLIILILPLVTSVNIVEWLRDLGTITGKASSATHTVSLSVQGFAPNISNVSISKTSWSITEGSKTILTVTFSVMDPDGLSNLDNSTAEVAINKTIGADILRRVNDSCAPGDNRGESSMNFSCEIPIWYWEMNGTWNINATICDEQGICTQNFTTVFTLGVTGSIQISPPAINFGSLVKGTANNTATDDPLVINNTGNLNVTLGNVQLKAIDLAGADALTTIGAENFTVGTLTGSLAECDWSANGDARANKTTNNTAIGITAAGLARGNLTNVEPCCNTTYQENLYFCFYKPVPTHLTPQAYSTTAPAGSWTISVV